MYLNVNCCVYQALEIALIHELEMEQILVLNEVLKSTMRGAVALSKYQHISPVTFSLISSSRRLRAHFPFPHFTIPETYLFVPFAY